MDGDRNLFRLAQRKESADMSDKPRVVTLEELYAHRERLDSIIERKEEQRRAAEQEHDLTIEEVRISDREHIRSMWNRVRGL